MSFATTAQKDAWERAGLCRSCGGFKFDIKAINCEKCKKKAVEKFQRRFKGVHNYTPPPEPPKPKEIRKDHKCLRCVWGKPNGGVIFCPLAIGTCAKEDGQW